MAVAAEGVAFRVGVAEVESGIGQPVEHRVGFICEVGSQGTLFIGLREMMFNAVEAKVFNEITLRGEAVRRRPNAAKVSR